MSRAILMIVGVLLVVITAMSMVRTVLGPAEAPRRLVRRTVRLCTSGGHLLSPRLPAAATGPLLAGTALLGLLMVLLAWLTAVQTGLQLAFGTMPALPRAGEEPGSPVCRSVVAWCRPVGCPPIVALAPAACVVAAFLAYALQLAGAYRRREGYAVRYAEANADLVLARLVGHDRPAEVLAEWQRWLCRLRQDHARHPVLAYLRPAGPAHWLDSTLALLDALALIEALAPRWAPYRIRPVLFSGIALVQHLEQVLGLVTVLPRVSLHGREENAFADTVWLARAAGLPAAPAGRRTWGAYQHLRRQFAPFVLAIELRVRPCRPVAVRGGGSGR